jgi:hypothetical protein
VVERPAVNPLMLWFVMVSQGWRHPGTVTTRINIGLSRGHGANCDKKRDLHVALEDQICPVRTSNPTSRMSSTGSKLPEKPYPERVSFFRAEVPRIHRELEIKPHIAHIERTDWITRLDNQAPRNQGLGGDSRLRSNCPTETGSRSGRVSLINAV